MRRRPSFFSSLSSLLLLAATLGACTPESDSPTPDAPVPTASDQPQAEPPAESLPDGAELLAAHVEASGGVALIAKFETMHMRGQLEVESQNLKGTMELWWRNDGSFYIEEQIEGVGTTRVGYDGATIWLEDPITGLRKLDGAEAAGYLQTSMMFLGHDWRRLFSAANTLGKQKLDGKDVWEVELVSKGGPNLTVWLDQETKLISYAKTTMPSLLGETPFEVRSDRYESIEGYKFPMHKTVSISGLLEIHDTITQTEVNVPIDAAMFAFPSKREVVPADPSKQPAITPPAAPAGDKPGK